jgi:hypothetical protein
MKKFGIAAAILVAMGLAVAGSAFLTGCEEAKGTHGLVVEPSFVDLTSGFTNFTQTFTVTEESLRELSLPLAWRVSNTDLGNITSSGGRSASYTRNNAHGDNSVFVEDQYGAQGTASVRQ